MKTKLLKIFMWLYRPLWSLIDLLHYKYLRPRSRFKVVRWSMSDFDKFTADVYMTDSDTGRRVRHIVSEESEHELMLTLTSMMWAEIADPFNMNARWRYEINVYDRDSDNEIKEEL